MSTTSSLSIIHQSARYVRKRFYFFIHEGDVAQAAYLTKRFHEYLNEVEDTILRDITQGNYPREHLLELEKEYLLLYIQYRNMYTTLKVTAERSGY